MNGKFILDGHTAIPEDDLLKWGEWMETGNREVAKDEIGEVIISTVFLGLDHSFGEGDPVLFETMVFKGKLDQEMNRYETWEQAEKGHAEMIERVKTA